MHLKRLTLVIRSKEMKISHSLPFLVALPCAGPLVAQGAYVPQTIVFTGASEYKASDLLAVAAMTPGKQVTSAQIDESMQRLVDTGLFSDLRYTVNSQALTYALTPVAGDQLLTARYSNFVWWKEEELTPLVHARIPLFTGKVPVTGTMKGQVESALAALVLEKGVKASVSSVVSSGQIGGSVSGQVFSITEPMIEVGEVRVEQVSSNASAKVAEIKKRTVGQEFDVHSSGDALRSNLTDAYLDLGCLDVMIDAPVRGEPEVSAMAVTVSLSTTAHEGAVYHVSRMGLPESAIVSKQAMADAAQLKPGDVASRIMLLSADAKIQGRFDAAGYLDAKASRSAQKDDSRHEISYAYSVDPGEQYKVAGVKTAGMNAEQQAEFDKTWKLAAGQVYNGDYVGVFLQKAGGTKPFQGYVFRPGRTPDRGTHTVVITIAVVKMGTSPS